MTDKQKKTLYRILVTGAMFLLLLVSDKAGMLEKIPKAEKFVLFLLPYLLIGYDILNKARKNICNGSVFDENFLMVIATFGAFAIGEYTEALAVMLFYQTGELFQNYAVGKSRKSVAELMSIAPEYANLLKDGQAEQVDPEDVEVGSRILIRPGEKVPLDGLVVEGDSYLETSALTGEAVPRHVKQGDEVISGCVNGEGTLIIQTSRVYEDSTVARILELVENAGSRKSRVENFITRFARYYTPAVTIGAVLLALVPPVLLGGGAAAFSEWLRRACIFLIVSCPCALVISVPLGFFGGIGAASRNGILVKGSNYLEQVSRLETVIFDKTGTLTKGEFKVAEICPEPGSGVTKEKLLEWAALGESASGHPIAKSVREAYGRPIRMERTGTARELAGLGLETVVDGQLLYIGNARLLEQKKISFTRCTDPGTVVYAAGERNALGYIRIADGMKEGAEEALASVRKQGVGKLIMLTGDRKEAAEETGRLLHIDEIHSDLLPEDKVKIAEQILARENKRGRTAFVGDGINDAPVLMRADVGIAMGSMGSDAAIEAADIVLMDDDLKKLPLVIRIASRTMRIVRQNIAFALGIKALVLILGAVGIANMWEAVFADVGVSVLAILNSMRVMPESRNMQK